MSDSYHIVNGDALLAQLPTQHLGGTVIVARECLSVGPVDAASVDDFIAARINYLAKSLPEMTPTMYLSMSTVEFDRIRQLPSDAQVYLWFEDDLFCQVNLWYVTYLLAGSNRSYRLALIRPPAHTAYSFGTLDGSGLLQAYADRIYIKDLLPWSHLWMAYRKGDIESLNRLGEQLSGAFPFVLPAIQAHIDRLPRGDYPGKPLAVMQDIVAQYGVDDFDAIFTAFSAKASIYGYGDIQVRALLDQIIEDKV